MSHVTPFSLKKKNKKNKVVTQPILSQIINWVELDVTVSSNSFFSFNHHHDEDQFINHQHACHVFSYQDMTMYITKKSIYSLYQLFYDSSHYSSGIFITNINQHYHPSSTSSIMLSSYATKVLTTPNAGGNSIWSETLSAEFLYRFLGLKVIYTEMELIYNSRNSPITDFACVSKENQMIGVSVTRAMAYRSFLTKKDVTRLLIKKLKGIQLSTNNVLNCQFQRQILHIWVQSGRDASIVKQAYLKLSSTFYSNTIVIITIINCPFVFFNHHHHHLIK